MEIVTSDKVRFVLQKGLYSQSILFRNIEEVASGKVDAPVEILVDSATFSMIVEFMEHHEKDEPVPEDYDPFDILFSDYDREFAQVENTVLFKLTSAANYLFMPFLLELCCKTIAEALKEKTSEQIKRYLEIPNDDHTKEDLEKICNDYKWIS